MKFIYYLTAFSFLNCSAVFFREKPGTLEYWKLSEKVFLDFYGSDDQRDEAFSTLKKRCNSAVKEEALSCYNLSVLYFYSKEFDKSYEFARKAVEKQPEDELFLDMLRQAAIESGQAENLKTDYPYEKEIAYSFAKLSIHCRKKDEKAALTELEFLISRDLISKEILNSPEYRECLSKDSLKAISHNAKSAKVNYKKFFLDAKKESHEFHSIWDTTNFFEKKKSESAEPPKKPLTKFWMDFRKSVAGNNAQAAKEYLKLFFEEIKTGLEKDKKNKHLYNSIDKAARLLIEQDKFFEKFKNLPKEL